MVETPGVDNTAHWQELPPAEAGYFSRLITANSEEVFGPVAHSAGIFTLAALRFTLRTGLEHCPAVEWTDPYTPNTSCIMVANQTRSPLEPLGFALVSELPEHYEITGITANAGDGNNGHVYGTMRIPRRIPAMQTIRSNVQLPANKIGASVQFFDAARAKARQFSQQLHDNPPSDERSSVLVDGPAVGRLSASLRSLAGNLATIGIQTAEGEYADTTFTLAKYVLGRVISDIQTGDLDCPDVAPVWDAGKRVTGASFTGPTLIRRLQAVPVPTIAVTTAAPDDNRVEQYFIQPRDTFRDITIIPADEDLTHDTFMRSVAILDRGLLAPVADRVILDRHTRRALEQKLLAIASGRIALSKPSGGVL